MEMPIVRECEFSLSSPQYPSNGEMVRAISRKTGVKPERIASFVLRKRSLDARGREVLFRYRAEYTLTGEGSVESFTLKPYKDLSASPQADAPERRVIIIGAGPAGLFAALALLQEGIKPVLLERGKDVHSRKYDMAALSRTGAVNPDSNYCFGEGGAGTFSDGKLYTRSTKRGDIREILHQFVRFGADSSILIESHAHIGSDKLPAIIENMRNCIIANGGEVHFNSRVTDLEYKDNLWSVAVGSFEGAGTGADASTDGSASGSGANRKGLCDNGLNGRGLTKNGDSLSGAVYTAANVILATGHSARDIYELFYRKRWEIEAKGFALGVRAEHPQELINNIQYRGKFRNGLPAAEYSLVTQVEGRGVFSFCMCPGGILVPSATEPGQMLLNGMSNSQRNSKWANAGIVVSIEPEDVSEFKSYGPLQLLKFQESIEHKAYISAGNSIKAPAQRMTDFVNGKISSDLPRSSYHPGVVSTPLHKLLPELVASRLRKAFPLFNNKMRGYFSPQALLLAVESRTSSPVRIPRDNCTLEHVSLKGLYPCGEGAGYSGGIVSSAMDGINAARAIAQKIN